VAILDAVLLIIKRHSASLKQNNPNIKIFGVKRIKRPQAESDGSPFGSFGNETPFEVK
jgi:hypothetical protein